MDSATTLPIAQNDEPGCFVASKGARHERSEPHDPPLEQDGCA